MLYGLVRIIWNTTKWITGIIIAFFIGYAANLAVMQAKDIPSSSLVSFVNWLFLPGHNRTLTLSILLPLFAITLLAGIITFIREKRSGGLALRKYLRDVIDKTHDLKPVGFSQQSALISVSVPLDDIFIHLRAATDRPRYDLPLEQSKQLEALRKRTGMTAEEREEAIQALRVVWHSQMGKLESGQPQNVAIEEVTRYVTARQPGAVILGSPGSGKSTTMRWLAYHLARGSRLSSIHKGLNRFLDLIGRLLRRELNIGYSLPDGLKPYQLPILVRISDYAKALSRPDSEELPFQPFFMEYFKLRYPELPRLADRLLNELQRGRCLLLLDGLDEVASDELRRRVAENISTFVAQHSPENGNARHFNRFIITSRIVGYEAGAFANYAHYTLQDLEDEQIEQFLANWCPAVERHQKTFAQGMRKLTLAETEQANKDGREQKTRLWEALQNNPGIKRLAVNPLMLTILALIQRSGKRLPHRRIELYQIVTRTLLDNWNQESGRRVFPADEIPLAEQMLASLAYEMHNTDRLLTEAKVKEIAGRAMQDFYGQVQKEQTIKNFIDTLRSSSGLFIETGQGFFSFMHRTFQEYFTAQQLLRRTWDELQDFVRVHSHIAIWHEPLLLLIAYKSTQSSSGEQKRASDLIRIIVDSSDEYDEILQRNLLLATSCVADCSAWSIELPLQHRIAECIFEIYGDPAGAGRYSALQQDTEKLMLAWLRGQPVESSDTRPPLLEAWYCALCDAHAPLRQEGAVHLLASLAPDLASCPRPVLSVVVPPLLQLADAVDMACPPEHMHRQLSRPAAQPATPRVTEYALVALRLLDKDGPAGWMHKQWLTWSKELPLERLTQHSLELDYLLTPAALPANSSDPHWDEQLNISQNWKQKAQRNPRELQLQLLQASNTARFPHAFLFRTMLLEETRTQSVPWQEIWDECLRREMMSGREITYQTCLNLRLLLCKGNEQKRQEIANELQTMLSGQKKMQNMTFSFISSINLRGLRELRDLLEVLNLRKLLDLLDLRKLRYFLDLRELRGFREFLDFRDLLDLLDLRNNIDYDFVTLKAFDVLKDGINSYSLSVLFCLYSVVATNDTVASQYNHQIQDSLRSFVGSLPAQQALEQRLLAKAVLRVLERTTTASHTPPSFPAQADERATKINELQQQASLSKQDAVELLSACTDTRKVTRATWQKLMSEKGPWSTEGTVGEVAWGLLSQPWSMNEEAEIVVVHALDDKDALVCAAAARLLQQAKKLEAGERRRAMEKIMAILRDDELSRRPLDTPGGGVERLDDLLFETLRVLVE